MPIPKAALFDNDGLLLDTESVWSRAEQTLFERRERTFTIEHKRALVGSSEKIAGRKLALFLDEPGREQEIMELVRLVRSLSDKNGTTPGTPAA